MIAAALARENFLEPKAIQANNLKHYFLEIINNKLYSAQIILHILIKLYKQNDRIVCLEGWCRCGGDGLACVLWRHTKGCSLSFEIGCLIYLNCQLDSVPEKVQHMCI